MRAGFSPSQPVSYSWVAVTERKRVPFENTERRRVNVLAALVRDATGSDLLWQAQPRSLTADDLLAFLRERLARTRTPVVVVLDNASIHHHRMIHAARAALVRAGILLYYLPPDSPELNAIELSPTSCTSFPSRAIMTRSGGHGLVMRQRPGGISRRAQPPLPMVANMGAVGDELTLPGALPDLLAAQVQFALGLA